MPNTDDLYEKPDHSQLFTKFLVWINAKFMAEFNGQKSGQALKISYAELWLKLYTGHHEKQSIDKYFHNIMFCTMPCSLFAIMNYRESTSTAIQIIPSDSMGNTCRAQDNFFKLY